MKAYSLMVYDYDETDLLGVFSSEREAQECMVAVVENSRSDWLNKKTGAIVEHYRQKFDYFSLVEWDLGEGKGI